MISDPRSASVDPQVNTRAQNVQEKSFHFVEPQSGRHRRSQERRDVRSFVMQRARRERPWSTSKRIKYALYGGNGRDSIGSNPSPSPGNALQPRAPSTKGKWRQPVEDDAQSGQPPTEIDHMLSWSIDPNETLWRAQSPQLGVNIPPARASIGSGVLDPFVSYPIDLDARSVALVEHYISVLAHEAIPVDVRRQSNVLKTQWFALAMTHRAFMHSLLATAAMHAFIVGKASYYDIVHHKSLAVQEININLSNTTSSIDDGNIAAVFSLLCVEESMLLPLMAHEGEGQDVASAQRLIHVNGLRRMIELRGGLAAPGMNQCLQALIIWHVALHSIASFYPPYLPLPEGGQQTHLYRGQVHYDTSRSAPSHVLRTCFDLGVDQDLGVLLDDLSVLTTQLAYWLDDPQAPFEPLDLQTRGNMIQVRLLGKYSERKTADASSPLESALCLAALVFTALTFQSRHEPGIQVLHHTALDQLINNLTLTQESEWSVAPDLLLWVLVIGAIGARGSPGLAWFLKRLSSFCFDRKLIAVNDVIERLRPLLWIDRQLNGLLTELWHSSVPHV